MAHQPNHHTMTDERYNAPSASAMRRIANCPPSHKLAQQYIDPGSAEASTGDKIHKAVELWGQHGSTDGLSVEELETAEMCIDQRNELLDAWIGDGDYAVHLERRLVMTGIGKVLDIEQVTPAVVVMFSGKADFVAVAGDRALVVDYKTLHGDHDHAAENDQLRSLAALVYRRHKVKSVRVAIVQPRKGRPTVADFDELLLDDAMAWVGGVIRAEIDATPDQVNAGDWCHYCPHRIKCSAFAEPILATVEKHAERLETLDDDTARKAMFARAAELPDAELAERYRALKWVGWYVNAVEGVTRMRAAENGEFASRYFRIEEGKGKESISDVALVWAELAKLGVSPEAFSAHCKTSKTAVKALVKEATGLKGKALDDAVRSCLTGAVKLGAPVQKIVPVGMLENQTTTTNEDDSQID
jgi:hypothetical protein